ncbi:MAG: hypothetical protein P8O16_03500 [Algoriphagus sp.]|uniref:hypothetical protein n=1 Tax=Algoriphagus sp. TaxID=1872435 RepID=UPI002639F9B4|nr:hypothetical protein [Algoriphagus sp.]MDG1276319.1 hypothetical protein [Algoriphagus sp.]
MKKSEKVLRINNVDELSPKKMLQLDDSIYEGKVKTILLDGVEVTFSLLLCAHIKSLMEKDKLIEGFYPCLLIENNIEEILGLVFNDGFLPDEIFAMGAGIYQFDDQDEYLLAYPENPYRRQFSLEESWIQRLKAKKGFLRIQISELQRHFRNDGHILETDAYYENSFPIFNYCGFEDYFLNWLRGHDFILEEGKFIVRNSDFDQVA